MIETEAPREPFRRELERKVEPWSHEVRGHVAIYSQNCGLASSTWTSSSSA